MTMLMSELRGLMEPSEGLLMLDASNRFAVEYPRLTASLDALVEAGSLNTLSRDNTSPTHQVAMAMLGLPSQESVGDIARRIWEGVLNIVRVIYEGIMSAVSFLLRLVMGSVTLFAGQRKSAMVVKRKTAEVKGKVQQAGQDTAYAGVVENTARVAEGKRGAGSQKQEASTIARTAKVEERDLHVAVLQDSGKMAGAVPAGWLVDGAIPAMKTNLTYTDENFTKIDDTRLKGIIAVMESTDQGLKAVNELFKTELPAVLDAIRDELLSGGKPASAFPEALSSYHGALAELLPGFIAPTQQLRSGKAFTYLIQLGDMDTGLTYVYGGSGMPYLQYNSKASLTPSTVPYPSESEYESIHELSKAIEKLDGNRQLQDFRRNKWKAPKRQPFNFDRVDELDQNAVIAYTKLEGEVITSESKTLMAIMLFIRDLTVVSIQLNTIFYKLSGGDVWRKDAL